MQFLILLSFQTLCFHSSGVCVFMGARKHLDCTLKVLQLQVAVFKIENSHNVFIVALFFTRHLTTHPVDANLLIHKSE